MHRSYSSTSMQGNGTINIVNELWYTGVYTIPYDLQRDTARNISVYGTYLLIRTPENSCSSKKERNRMENERKERKETRKEKKKKTKQIFAQGACRVPRGQSCWHT